MITATLIDEVHVGNLLGEGIQWNIEDQAVWWTDILTSALYRYDPVSFSVTKLAMPEPLGSFAFHQNGEAMVTAFASGFASLDLASDSITWIERPAFLAGEGRFNDGRADRQGRFWSGTMMANPGDGSPPTGRLFCLDQNLAASVHETGINISNGICWSPSGETMYFADSLKGEIVQYDFNTQAGTLSNRRLFAKSPDGASPDGATVDTQGNVWSAQWGIGKVFAYRPDGQLVFELNVPASQPTCVAFGGPDLDVLYVSSACDGLPESVLKNEPSAGNIFAYKTSVQGLPETRFTGIIPANKMGR